ANEPQAAQWLQHLDPVRTHALIETIVAERVGAVDRPLAVAATNGDVGVDDSEVRVHAEATDQEDVTRAVVGVEVAAVVEVAVAGTDVLHRQRRLVDRELVEGNWHLTPSTCRPTCVPRT